MKSKFIDFMLSAFFPNKCPYCKKNIKPDMTECPECLEKMPTVPKKAMTSAGIPCMAPFSYDGEVRNSIIDFKFNSIAFNAESYAKRLCFTIEYYHILDEFDIITFVPLSKIRKNERGFNQSETVAKLVGESLDKPVMPLLKKIRQNKNQHDLNFAERIENVKGIYMPVHAEYAKGKNILLIDDIATTGNTLSECCRVLHESGANNIICIAIAIAGAV